MAHAVVDSFAAFDAAPFEEEFCAVCISVFDGVVVEVLIDVCHARFICLVMLASDAVCFYGPGVLHPALMIDDVDVEVAVASAGRPEEAVEPLDLVHQIRDAVGLGR